MFDAGDGAAVAVPVLDAGDELAADVEDVHQVLDATAADVHQVLDATAADVHQVLDATAADVVDAGELEDVHQGDASEIAADVVDAGAPADAADAGPPPFLCIVFAGTCSGAYPVECFGNECCNRACQ